MRRIVFSAGLAAALCVGAAFGHEGPSRVIDDLTFRMEVAGPSAHLLTARAYEYRSLKRMEQAAADFQEALRLSPKSDAALYGLAETLIDLGQADRVLALAERGAALSNDAARQGPYHALRARALMLKAKWEEAREAWAAALDSPRPEIDWFLGEAQCLDQMNRPQERAVCLGDAVERNTSSVLRRAWVDALIETGDLDAASREIAAGLERSRRKSTWLLLRARLHEARGQTTARNADATAALEELRPLLRTATPDPWLVTEAGIALAMLGNEDAARRSIVRAKQQGAPDHWLNKIVERIE